MSEKYRTNPFFNGVSTFKAAFPGLSDAFIEWRERRGSADTAQGEARKTSYRRGNFTQGVLPCSNPNCHEGGYEIDRLVADMLSLGETDREGMLLCSGREIGEETRRGPVRCRQRIDYRATLSPRGELEEGQDRRQGRRSFHRRGRNRPPRRNSAA